MGYGKRDSVIGNAVSMLGARLAVPLLNVALVVSVARVLGVSQLGQYTLLTTLFLLWENLKALGLPTLMVREIARDGDSGLVYYRGLVRIGLGGASVGIAAAVAIFWMAGRSSLLLPALVLSLGLLPSAYVLANDALFLALGQARHSVKIAFVENSVRLAASLLAVLVFRRGILSLCVAYAVTRALAALAGAFVIRRNLGLTLPPSTPTVIWTMLRRAPAFVVIFAFPIVLFRMDVVLLGNLKDDYEVGLYSAAIRLIAVCLLIPDSLMTATFSALSNLSGSATLVEFRELVRRALHWVTLLLLPIAIVGFFAAPVIVRLVYGPNFSSAIPIFQVLVWGLVPFGINRVLGDSLVAQGKQSTVASIVLCALLLSSGIYVLLIRRNGAIGTAWGFVLSIFLMCLLTIVWSVRVKGLGLADLFTVSLSLTPGVAGLLAVGDHRAARVGIVAPAFVTALGLFVILFMGRSELQQLRSWRLDRLNSVRRRDELGAANQ